MARPVIRCGQLTDFDDTDLTTVRAAFAAATPCALGQQWRAGLEQDFAPGQVRVGWRRDDLLVFAELTDRDIFSRATSDNQRMWELGDTFEMFFRPDGQTEYFEFHVTPNNHRLQLRFPDATALERLRATNRLDEFVLSGEAFCCQTWVPPENQKWFVFAVIPGSTVCCQARLDVGSCWHFSFSRYDSTSGRSEAVISSTSPHPVADFHRQEDWGELIIADSTS